MPKDRPDIERSGEALRLALADQVRDAPPALAGFAAWALEHPEDIAFHSLRAVADRAGVNANTVYRLSVALGYSGYEACRRNFQTALVSQSPSYSTRARNLSDQSGSNLIDGIRRTTLNNVDSMLDAANASAIRQAASLLRETPQALCLGVRSSFALAHYFAYTGGMAFGHFAPPVVEAGSILDRVARCAPGDVVVLVTFSLYSREILDAHRVARENGVAIVAITDGYASPVAEGADLVFVLPMQGPQTLPSLSAGFALVEAIVNEMIATDTQAPARVADFEQRLLRNGIYSRRQDG